MKNFIITAIVVLTLIFSCKKTNTSSPEVSNESSIEFKLNHKKKPLGSIVYDNVSKITSFSIADTSFVIENKKFVTLKDNMIYFSLRIFDSKSNETLLLDGHFNKNKVLIYDILIEK
jgi:hypothetical protein